MLRSGKVVREYLLTDGHLDLFGLIAADEL